MIKCTFCFEAFHWMKDCPFLVETKWRAMIINGKGNMNKSKAKRWIGHHMDKNIKPHKGKKGYVKKGNNCETLPQGECEWH